MKEVINQFLNSNEEDGTSNDLKKALSILKLENEKESKDLKDHLNDLAIHHKSILETMNKGAQENNLEVLMRAALNNNKEGELSQKLSFVPDDIIREFLSEDEDE